MVVAILLGALCGAVSFLPLIACLALVRRVNSASSVGSMGLLLLGVFISLAVLIVAAVVCIKLARDLALPFVLAEGITLIVVAIVFGVCKLVKK